MENRDSNKAIKLVRITLRLSFILIVSAVVTSCETLSGYLWYLSLKPDSQFEEPAQSARRDYFALESWAAHPEIENNSNISVSRALTSDKRRHGIDVFYVHPTTYYSSDNWNQPVNDQEANELTDNWVLLNQAGIFSDCCDIYAPRYRQATLYAVLSDDPDGDKALELAYQDVKAAFEYYLRYFNRGRPFIIASHSQGSWHALRLTEELIAPSLLKDRLVTAYLVGMPLPKDKLTSSLKGLSVCQQPTQSHCLVSWNAVANEADTSFYRDYARVWYDDHYEANQGKELVCVNPLTWSSNNELAPPSLNIGGINFKLSYSTKPQPDIAVTGAQCLNGMLYISEPRTQNYDWFLFGEGNYHMHDYDLFYLNIKENVRARIQAYKDQAW